MASPRQLCCTCAVSSLFWHSPCCCRVTGSGGQMLCCVPFPGRYRDVWCSLSMGRTFVESRPDAVLHYCPFQVVSAAKKSPRVEESMRWGQTLGTPLLSLALST